MKSQQGIAQIFVLFLILIGLVISVLTVQQATNIFPKASSDAEIDTLTYLIGQGGRSLTGTHPRTTSLDSSLIYLTKWDSNVFEILTHDNDYIYLKEDHSGAPVNYYSFEPGTWMKRYMSVGETIEVRDNLIQWYSPSCEPVGLPERYPFTMTLLEHNPAYDFGGDLGKLDTIILKYDWSPDNPQGGYEKFYYTKEYGWVLWEEYTKTDDSKAKFTSIFNQFSNMPIEASKTSSCAGLIEEAPLPTPSSIPTPTPAPSDSPIPAPSSSSPTPSSAPTNVPRRYPIWNTPFSAPGPSTTPESSSTPNPKFFTF